MQVRHVDYEELVDLMIDAGITALEAKRCVVIQFNTALRRPLRGRLPQVRLKPVGIPPEYHNDVNPSRSLQLRHAAFLVVTLYAQATSRPIFELKIRWPSTHEAAPLFDNTLTAAALAQMSARMPWYGMHVHFR